MYRFVNAVLDLDPESRQRLKKLEGKAINIELRPFHFIFHCTFINDKLQFVYHESLQAEATIRGTPLQMLGVMIDKQNRQRFFADDLTIEGDAEAAQQLIDLFDRLDIDWEEILSHFVGDIPAHHGGSLFRRALSWVKRAGSELTQDLNEYTHEEAMWFPTREALNDFFNEIDTLKMDADRLEVKINMLEEV